MAHRYLILDSRGNAVAHGVSDQTSGKELWRLQIDDGDIDQVMSHTILRLVGDSDAVPALEGRIVRQEGNTVYLEPIRPLGEELRKNLRIPVHFSSFLYPISGQWQGRIPIVSYDLSCGGLAFFAPRLLEVGETAQVVIPVTAQPVLLTLRILHCRPAPEGGNFHAAQFVDLIREEESLVREAVFSLQLQKH